MLQLSSLVVAKSILHQVTAALAVAEQELCFEHRYAHTRTLTATYSSNLNFSHTGHTNYRTRRIWSVVSDVPRCSSAQGPPLGERAGEAHHGEAGGVPAGRNGPLPEHQGGVRPPHRLLPLQIGDRSVHSLISLSL